MAIYELTHHEFAEIPQTTFDVQGVRERGDIQRLLRQQIEIVSPETLVIAEEFGEWEDSRRRIDLLGVDKNANLVVIELKRTEDGGHMELQALRYAAMVSAMTFDKVVDIYGRYLSKLGCSDDPREALLSFLEWEEEDPEQFAQDVRIVLVSAEFSKELTTTVMWLNERSLNMRCVRLKPYRLDDRLLVDAQQVIPLPEAEQYQVQIREKYQEERRQGRRRKWDEASFMCELAHNFDQDAMELARSILAWIDPKVDYVWWGEGGLSGSFTPTVVKAGVRYHLWVMRSNGKIATRFSELKRKGPFRDEKLRRDLLNRYNRIAGVSLPGDAIDRNPRFELELLKNPQGLEAFKEVTEWLLQNIKAQ